MNGPVLPPSASASGATERTEMSGTSDTHPTSQQGPFVLRTMTNSHGNLSIKRPLARYYALFLSIPLFLCIGGALAALTLAGLHPPSTGLIVVGVICLLLGSFCVFTLSRPDRVVVLNRDKRVVVGFGWHRKISAHHARFVHEDNVLLLYVESAEGNGKERVIEMFLGVPTKECAGAARKLNRALVAARDGNGISYAAAESGDNGHDFEGVWDAAMEEQRAV